MDADDESSITVHIRYEKRVRVYTCYSLNISGIHRAVYEGDLCRVKRWIESGGSVNARENSYSYSALHLAVMRNNMEILEYLLTREDIEVDGASSQDKTPLFLATELGYIEMVKKLIQAGADINTADFNNDTVFHMPVRHPDICHFLIQHGALIEAVNFQLDTPLNTAVIFEYMETIHMLLYYNADVNAVETAFCPFVVALSHFSVSAQEALIEYVDDFNRPSCYDQYPDRRTVVYSILSYALRTNSPFIKDIIDRGADVNYGDDPRISDGVCAFFDCVIRPVDLSTFKMIWERLRYNNSRDTINLLDFLDCFNEAPRYLQVIIDSDNFQPVIEFCSKGDNYFLFISKFAEKKKDLEQLTLLTCRLLEHGYRATSYEVHVIFSNYGYCELFRILLYMDIDFARGWLPQMALTRLIFDIDYALESVVDKVNDIPKEIVLQLLEYSICPRLIDALTIQYGFDASVSAILSNLPKVPSLIELARNPARKQIWQSFKVTNTCQFYTTIDHLAIPTVYKNVLTFKKTMYSIK